MHPIVPGIVLLRDRPLDFLATLAPLRKVAEIWKAKSRKKAKSARKTSAKMSALDRENARLQVLLAGLKGGE